MNLHDFFVSMAYALNEETNEYIKNIDEVSLKLLVKRVYENNEIVKNELNKQIKMTKYPNIKELVKSFDRPETEKFLYWMCENVFSAPQSVEEELNKILSE